MAYNDEAVRAKLSTLNETQESIVTVAQWIMFHRRHADRTASLWLEKSKDSNPAKRLNLIYLANEVVQQSKARKRDDFLLAFSPLIPEAVTIAFRGAHSEIRNKIKRVVEVWRQRNIFDEAIQVAVEGRIAELEKTQSSGAKKLLGGNLFSGSSTPGPSAPEELKPLVPLQESLNKSSMAIGDSVEKASSEYKSTMENSGTSSLPVQVARYSSLFKSLANAENAVVESVKARKALLDALETLISSNRNQLESEEKRRLELTNKKTEIESRKRDVEDAIMKGLTVAEGEENSTANGNEVNQNRSESPARPATEELTPPPVETITPVDSPEFQPADVTDEVAQLRDDTDERAPNWDAPEARDEMLTSLSRPFSSTEMSEDTTASNKKQRLDEYGADSTQGLNSDLDTLIRSEGRI